MTVIDTDWVRSDVAKKIFDAFEGYELFFVGGCVRNALLGEPVIDFDLATNALPDEVLKIAERAGIRAVPTGIDHGTITLIEDGVPFEVTTYRTDVETDGRRAKVAYSDSVLEDARRRDFTINAIYADREGNVIDPIGGLPELANRTIRFIGDPRARIKEDYLRILRFFRFFAWYGDPQAGIEAEGLAACAEFVDQIPTLSKERVTSEFLKLLAAPNPSMSVASMAAIGALAQCLPGATADVLHVLIHNETIARLRPDPMLRLVALGGSPENDLRLSKKQVRALQNLKASHPTAAETGYRLKDEAIPALVLQASSIGAEVDSKQAEMARIGITAQFPVSAKDLMDRAEGPALGRKLVELEQRWIESDFQLTKEDLLA
ncbi:CCA tRNA nucleotidyltransferase [Cognatiyoonia sp.]|uniref:CCA tRNA nucleotidyltransferase n=1 Tax=Cognatiyoonia sp. TaxID=2211652 RepID=UPI003F698AF7